MSAIILSAVPTADLITELLDRKFRRLATVSRIDAAIGIESPAYSLADARAAQAVAEAIAHESNLEGTQILIERNRHTYSIAPRKLWHWWLRTQLGWSFERCALHVGRDHTAVIHSVSCVARELDVFLPAINRIRERLELAHIALA